VSTRQTSALELLADVSRLLTSLRSEIYRADQLPAGAEQTAALVHAHGYADTIDAALDELHSELLQLRLSPADHLGRVPGAEERAVPRRRGRAAGARRLAARLRRAAL
jgi:hypothetical protein